MGMQRLYDSGYEIWDINQNIKEATFVCPVKNNDGHSERIK